MINHKAKKVSSIKKRLVFFRLPFLPIFIIRRVFKAKWMKPYHLEIFPAHGEGSLRGRGMSAQKSSTLGYERRTNPMPRFVFFKRESDQ